MNCYFTDVYIICEKLSFHIVDCATTNDCAIILPNENDKWLMFRHNKKEKLLFVVYANLECILEKKTNDMKTFRDSPINIIRFSA